MVRTRCASSGRPCEPVDQPAQSHRRRHRVQQRVLAEPVPVIGHAGPAGGVGVSQFVDAVDRADLVVARPGRSARAGRRRRTPADCRGSAPPPAGPAARSAGVGIRLPISMPTNRSTAWAVVIRWMRANTLCRRRWCVPARRGGGAGRRGSAPRRHARQARINTAVEPPECGAQVGDRRSEHGADDIGAGGRRRRAPRPPTPTPNRRRNSPHSPTGRRGQADPVVAERGAQPVEARGSRVLCGAPHSPWVPSWSGTDTAQPSASAAATRRYSSCAKDPSACGTPAHRIGGKQRG